MATSDSKSKVTNDHETIRKWVEEREGIPAAVSSTHKGGEIGVIRIMFPDRGRSDNLTPINWDDFFTKFDENNLKLLYQEKTSDGKLSRFFKFISGGKK